MKLEQIEQKIYQKRLRLVMLTVVVAMCVISIPFSAVLIVLVGDPAGGNFILNLLGVVVAALVVVTALKHYSANPWMHEVRYVWRLKQQLNRITRKLKAIKLAAEQGDRDAIIILNFSYRGSEQLYTLDNNIITIDEVRAQIHALEQQISDLNLQVCLDDYSEELVDRF